ncbi:septal ring lytic transglycosylase RlpA family protein [Pontibacter sp. Tf4]|uniref:septal ring lytic transglycosylase RlpA family protein n=1 Tax=Pontibacter sp. Tf4 TaxID=2761620 RepID=UPI001628F650|nr:septal ring lytic transglycosylase RlpA family protein [Pontibacter sp. Tf4]MBB6609744.1 septal ring lytic transglycosylase RlpA family protein [Pontibacter sp. Tf4]
MIYNRKCILLSVIIFLFIGLGQTALAQDSNQTQTGKASWYGSKYHGRKTSSGERYNKNDMTAAHNTLPFGTKVKVTNLANNESVVLRINDRGPYVGKRIIDVSEVAAKQLDMHKQGVAQVKVEVLELPGNALSKAEDPFKPNTYTIQRGAYTSEELALEQSQKLKAFDKSLTVELKEEKVMGKKMHRLRIGQFETKQHAEAFNELLKEEGLEGKVLES